MFGFGNKHKNLSAADLIDRELARLHQELNTSAVSDHEYVLVFEEIKRINDKLLEILEMEIDYNGDH